MSITPPNTFVTGTRIVAADVNENFDELGAKALNRTGDTITGTIAVDSGITIDGRDISADIDQAVKTTSSPTHVALTLTSASAAALNASAGGITLGSTIKERGRSVPLGEWTAVAFNAGDFTAASGNWTVDSGDVTLFRYTLIGKTMIVSIYVQNTDVSATPSYLAVLIPGGFTAANTTMAFGVGSDAGSLANVQAQVESGTIIKFYKFGAAGWGATSGDNTTVQVTITFEVA